MGLLSPILRHLEGGRLAWWCPGCGNAHQVTVAAVARVPTPDAAAPDWTPPAEFYAARGGWTWNGSAVRPTLQPSVLVSYDGADAGRDGAPPAICHSFVVDGHMQMLSDCTHHLAGRTVPIPPWPSAELAAQQPTT